MSYNDYDYAAQRHDQDASAHWSSGNNMAYWNSNVEASNARQSAEFQRQDEARRAQSSEMWRTPTPGVVFPPTATYSSTRSVSSDRQRKRSAEEIEVEIEGTRLLRKIFVYFPLLGLLATATLMAIAGFANHLSVFGPKGYSGHLVQQALNGEDLAAPSIYLNANALAKPIDLADLTKKSRVDIASVANAHAQTRLDSYRCVMQVQCRVELESKYPASTQRIFGLARTFLMRQGADVAQYKASRKDLCLLEPKLLPKHADISSIGESCKFIAEATNNKYDTEIIALYRKIASSNQITMAKFLSLNPLDRFFPL